MARTIRIVVLLCVTLLVPPAMGNDRGLRDALQGLNPRTIDGAQAIVETVNEFLFRDDGRAMGSTKLRCGMA